MIGRFFMVAIGGALAASAVPARAELILSEVIVELQPGASSHRDVEIWNNSPERAYLVAEPREIVDPGQPTETVRRDPDPEKLGLLVAPTRAILEPGQRKLLRIASLAGVPQRERVYRVTVKPVTGALTSDQSGLKLLLGYDVLVMVRPAAAAPSIAATRSSGKLLLRNDGNSSVEMFNGRQCDASGGACVNLPAKRLYAGAQWQIDLRSSGPVEYSVRSMTRTAQRRF